MFSAFTPEEVDSIRSVVFVGQYDNEDLLLNSTSRPLNQTRAFIRRFKRYLLDLQYNSLEIVNMANQQYISIIKTIRSKKSNQNSQITSNLKNSILDSQLSSTFVLNSVPIKFRSKLIHETQNSPTIQPSPSSSSSQTIVSSNTKTQHKYYNPSQFQNQNVIPYLPVSPYKHPRALSSINIPAGSLAAIFRSPSEPPVVCRILGARKINGYDYLLVSFFQKGVIPCYVPPQSIIPIISNYFENNCPVHFSVDIILEHIMKIAQYLIIQNAENIQSNSQNNSQNSSQNFSDNDNNNNQNSDSLEKPDLNVLSSLNHNLNNHKNSDDNSNLSSKSTSETNPLPDHVQQLIHLSTFNCAVQLLLLSFFGNWEIPENKVTKIVDAIFSLSQIKYQSTKASFERGKQLLKDIIQKIKNDSTSTSSSSSS